MNGVIGDNTRNGILCTLSPQTLPNCSHQSGKEETLLPLPYPTKEADRQGRHNYATRLLEKNVQLVDIQALLGHESIATTQIHRHAGQEWLSKLVADI
ncbi:MAG: tyrosine-type recombinase/integrase [Methylococcaceae bacterium]|nr:tyrosine-type recombinase/integrase [Methylococcaceae bacterium]